MRKLKENVIMSFAVTIIAAINVVLAITNVFIDSVFLRGFIYGVLFTTVTLSFVRLGIIGYNEKIDKIKYNKKIGFREDFDCLNRWHLVTYVKGYKVSTVDLGIDHNLLGEGEPLYYETMIFNIKNYLKLRRKCKCQINHMKFSQKYLRMSLLPM